LAALARGQREPGDAGAADTDVAPGPDADDRRAPSLLELGIGTGRLAIPLARLGFDVWGVDASTAMLERLRAKPGGELVHAVAADMAALDDARDAGAAGTEGAEGTDVDHHASPSEPTSGSHPPAGPRTGRAARRRATLPDYRFRVVFASFNTFFNLTSESAQARCLDGVVRRLTPDGVFVVEAFVPADPPPRSGAVEVSRVETDLVVLTVSKTHLDDQVVDGQHVELRAEGIRLRPWRIRYLTPAQLDRMAEGAGMRLVHRWGGWNEEPFDEASSAHVSVYGLRRGARGER
jgi:SAM-dependent methyltransferase